ncbi:hypothetical protein BJ742DRAFT_776151 [Cladochytrium replicatum]|nr:hypothetical protein BJ742DRAFT_776151 [Cladochytrium replicatum]
MVRAHFDYVERDIVHGTLRGVYTTHSTTAPCASISPFTRSLTRFVLPSAIDTVPSRRIIAGTNADCPKPYYLNVSLHQPSTQHQRHLLRPTWPSPPRIAHLSLQTTRHPSRECGTVGGTITRLCRKRKERSSRRMSIGTVGESLKVSHLNLGLHPKKRTAEEEAQVDSLLAELELTKEDFKVKRAKATPAKSLSKKPATLMSQKTRAASEKTTIDSVVDVSNQPLVVATLKDLKTRCNKVIILFPLIHGIDPKALCFRSTKPKGGTTIVTRSSARPLIADESETIPIESKVAPFGEEYGGHEAALGGSGTDTDDNDERAGGGACACEVEDDDARDKLRVASQS